MEERQLEREAQQRKQDREFQLQMILMMGHNMHSTLGLPNNLGQSSSMDQTSSPSSFAIGDLYNACLLLTINL